MIGDSASPPRRSIVPETLTFSQVDGIVQQTAALACAGFVKELWGLAVDARVCTRSRLTSAMTRLPGGSAPITVGAGPISRPSCSPIGQAHIAESLSLRVSRAVGAIAWEIAWNEVARVKEWT